MNNITKGERKRFILSWPALDKRTPLCPHLPTNGGRKGLSAAALALLLALVAAVFPFSVERVPHVMIVTAVGAIPPHPPHFPQTIRLCVTLY